MVDQQTINSDVTNWSFTDKPKYEKGEEIVYSVTENMVEGYQSVVEGYDITNRYTPKLTFVNVSKVWVDENNQDKLRPVKVRVKLFASGHDTGRYVELNEENKWLAQLSNLPMYMNGEKVVYTVVEASVNGYQSVVAGNMVEGFVVTNTHNPKPEKPEKPEKLEKPEKSELPNIGMTSSIELSVGGSACSRCSHLAFKEEKHTIKKVLLRSCRKGSRPCSPFCFGLNKQEF